MEGINSNKIALIVGGGIQHSFVINILKDYGYWVILVDNTTNPPCKDLVDEFIHENGFSPDVLERIAVSKHVTVIINICYDLAVPAVAYVSEKLGLPCPYSYEQALNNTDKMRMKSVFSEHGIPTAKYFIVGDDEIDNFSSELAFPVVVKPVDSSGSRGITKVCSSDECVNAIKRAISYSQSSKAIVEEFLYGPEFQIDCVVIDGEAQVVMSKQKLRFVNDDVVSPAGSYIVPDESNSLYDAECLIANKIAKAFSIHNGVFFFQCISLNGTLYVIEIGVRIGAGFSYKMIRDIKGVDFVRIAVDAWLGKKISFQPRRIVDYYLTNALFANVPSVVTSVSGLEELQEKGIIDDYDVYVRAPKDIDGTITNKNRLALFLMHANNLEFLKEKFLKLVNTVDVRDSNGLSVFEPTLYVSLINRICK